ADELYRDADINQGRGLPLSQDIEDSHMTLTSVNLDGMESIFVTASSLVAPLQTSTPIITPSTIATITTISHAPIPPTPIPSEVLQNLPTFDSVFRFDERLKSLEASFSEYRQTNPFVKSISNILGIVHQYINQQMNEEVRVAVQIQTDRLRDFYQRENDEFLRSIDDNMKGIIKEQFKADLLEMELKKILFEKMEERVILKRRRDDDDDQGEGPSAGSDWGSKRQREGKESESASAPLQTATRGVGRSTSGSKSRQASASESAFAEEHVQTTSQIEEPSHPKPPTPDRDWNKTLPAAPGSTQTWISELAKQADSRSSFNELLDTPLDFSNFIMNWLRVDTLTPELLAGPTYKLMKGSCNSLTELEYHLEEVYKAITDQLDWVNPKGQQYLHNLLQPLPLIPDNRGLRVIPFAHFINNDLEYLRGGCLQGVSSSSDMWKIFNWESKATRRGSTLPSQTRIDPI
nr:hypothetical protein [Tanacetum cinerariifolium]